MDCDSGRENKEKENSYVVTLVHFYCGLRLEPEAVEVEPLFVGSNPCPFLLWIATSQ